MNKEDKVKKALEEMKKYTTQKTTEKESKVSEALKNMQTSVNNYNNTLSEINRLQNAANYPSYNDQVIALQNKAKQDEEERKKAEKEAYENMSGFEKFYNNVIEPTNNFMDNLVYGALEIPR